MELYRSIYNVALQFWNVVSTFLDDLQKTSIPFLKTWGPFWKWEVADINLLELSLTTGFTAVLIYRIARSLTV